MGNWAALYADKWNLCPD